MRRITYSLQEKASLSLNAAAQREPAAAAPMAIRMATAALRMETPESPNRRVPVIIETKGNAGPQVAERLEPLSGRFFSAFLTPEAALAIAALPEVLRVQTKRRKRPTLDHVAGDIGLTAAIGTPRIVEETGRGVFVGIIDSGFDLSHPAFRDASGNLRVTALLEQHDDGTETVFTTEELEEAWHDGGAADLPGFDADGHGTHVASIAAGSAVAGMSGIAPDARLLLVKTDFTNTDSAASWIFRRAGDTPCVINMSLGSHLGGHDGTDIEERLHERLTATPGRAIVISAGNERTDSIHIGGRFHESQVQEAKFDLVMPDEGPPGVVLTLWYGAADRFDIELVTPRGVSLPLPAIGKADRVTSSLMEIELARKRHRLSASIHAQIDISFLRRSIRRADLRGWRIRMKCTRASVGRLDGWFHDSGFAEFRANPLVEENRTVCLAATGNGCIAVASHISRNRWDSDAGRQKDTGAVIGRSSPFSSLGPTRDGRAKPDLSAPGQYVTAALADGSESADDESRAHTESRLLTIEGTSMAAPVVTGVVALLLQKRPHATLAHIRDVLQCSARRDLHTGPAAWDPTYGFGKIDVQRALALI
ncbi:MAG TPA: S8 family serine peptidase [Thermoanaerobaculia bacterium]|jgi:subtilisin family serine protease